MLVLALETSCDETAVALFEAGRGLRAARVSSQAAVHAAFGGVVPEVASRHHLRLLAPAVEGALREAGLAPRQIDAFAGTAGPGLASALLVGLNAAKGMALAAGRPFLAVNHLEGHLLSPFYPGQDGISPCLGLVVSGGHTLTVAIDGVGRYRVLGRTRDDAAGEAFDKVAKLLGLGYPGGPEIERAARGGDPARFPLPRALRATGELDFSFSGLKTAVRSLLPQVREGDMADLCASFQEAVVDALVEKTLRAARQIGTRGVAASGGVICNARLREALGAACRGAGLELRLAEPWLCTDNAAMIAHVAAHRLSAGERSGLGADIDPNLGL